MKLRLSLLATALLFVTSFASAQTPSFCSQTVIDQAKVISNPQMVANAARTLINQGADVHVVTVNSASFQKYGQLAGVESYLESQCPSWTTNGVRKANLFVVMVAPKDRAKNMFLGSYYAGAFDIGSTYSQYANSYFKGGDFGGGLAATLQGTTGSALNFHNRQFQAQQQQQTQPRRAVPTVPPSYPQSYQQPQQASSGPSISGFAIFMTVMFVLVVLAIILYFVFRDAGTTTNTTTYVEREPSGYDYGRRSYGAAAPGHTTIINNSTPQYDSSGNLITGVLIGEAIANNNRPVIVNQPSPYYTPNYVEPTPSYVPDAPAPPVQVAPDSTWEAPSTPTYSAPEPETTSFEPDPAPSYEAPSQDTSWSDPSPSTDFGSSNNDSGF